MHAESRREELEVYEFGEFRLDVRDRSLMRRDGARIHLPPKAYEVLVVLVRGANVLITKQELLDDVWPNVHVEEGILTVHVAHLRKRLGDLRQSPRYIETVSRFGYRFVADVRRIVPSDQWGHWRPPPIDHSGVHAKL